MVAEDPCSHPLLLLSCPSLIIYTYKVTEETNTIYRRTHPSVKAVHLVGSWDNFGKPYTMERDIRRDRGQWKGCYTFKDIICDGDSGRTTKRNGGLKMGQTYYFYVSLFSMRYVRRTLSLTETSSTS